MCHGEAGVDSDSRWGSDAACGGVAIYLLFFLLLFTLYTHLLGAVRLNPPSPPIKSTDLFISSLFTPEWAASPIPEWVIIKYGLGEARGHSPWSTRLLKAQKASPRMLYPSKLRSSGVRGWGQQTSDQIPERKLQLGSCGKSAKLFIGLMGCRLQYNS